MRAYHEVRWGIQRILEAEGRTTVETATVPVLADSSGVSTAACNGGIDHDRRSIPVCRRSITRQFKRSKRTILTVLEERPIEPVPKLRTGARVGGGPFDTTDRHTSRSGGVEHRRHAWRITTLHTAEGEGGLDGTGKIRIRTAGIGNEPSRFRGRVRVGSPVVSAGSLIDQLTIGVVTEPRRGEIEGVSADRELFTRHAVIHHGVCIVYRGDSQQRVTLLLGRDAPSGGARAVGVIVPQAGVRHGSDIRVPSRGSRRSVRVQRSVLPILEERALETYGLSVDGRPCTYIGTAPRHGTDRLIGRSWSRSHRHIRRCNISCAADGESTPCVTISHIGIRRPEAEPLRIRQGGRLT